MASRATAVLTTAAFELECHQNTASTATKAAAKGTTNHVLDWGFCSVLRSIRKPSSGGLDKLIQIFMRSKAGFAVSVKPCVGKAIVICFTNIVVKRTKFTKKQAG